VNLSIDDRLARCADRRPEQLLFHEEPLKTLSDGKSIAVVVQLPDRTLELFDATVGRIHARDTVLALESEPAIRRDKSDTIEHSQA
jgi:hypothetical protein